MLSGREGCKKLIRMIDSLPCQCPIDFSSDKLAENAANDDHMTIGCCNPRKCELIAKCPDPDHMIIWC